jgi:hypothetical protein
MLKIAQNEKKLVRLATQKLADADILERYDLQEYLYNSPEAFCDEIGEDLELLGKEVKPSPRVQDRIDLLAVDGDGNAVVIELKRGHDRLQLLQAIAYAGMVSKWRPEDFESAAQTGKGLDDFKQFLDESDLEAEDINQRQRILLVAEEFDYEVLFGAEWLHEAHQVEVKCIRVQLGLDSESGTKTKYLTFTQIYPTKELDEFAIDRSPRGQGHSEDGIPAPEFLAAVNAYNATAAPGMLAEGTAPAYRNIHPAEWPYKKFLTYSFSRKGDGTIVYLSVHRDAPEGYAELLEPLQGKTIANGQATLTWLEQEQHRGRWRLYAKFSLSASADTIGQGMHDLVKLTHVLVTDKLNSAASKVQAASQ